MMEAFVYAIVVPLGVCAWAFATAIVIETIKFIFNKKK